jgi:L,D-transpeptidase catalytic domain
VRSGIMITPSLTLRRRVAVSAAVACFALTTTAQAMQSAAESTPLADSTAPLPVAEVRVVVSLEARTLWVVVGRDTVRQAPIAVASGRLLEYGGRRWRFETPKGTHVIKAKRPDPVWMPPDWHYAEVARTHGLQLKRLPPRGYVLSDGRKLTVRDSLVGIESEGPDSFDVLPIDEHIVFDSTLFIPPVSARNRQLAGELGRFALDLGDGYLLHGTREPGSIGTASTHGCIRLGDDDLAWLYAHIPVGAIVLVR